MSVLRLAAVVLAGSTISLATTISAGYSAGPPVAKNGGFGGATCVECHNSFVENEGKGELTLTGVPDVYVPGDKYDLTVEFVEEGMKKGGFELSARFAEGDAAGTKAGSLTPSDARVQVFPDRRAQMMTPYAMHTLESGVAPEDGRLSWSVQWTAPEVGNGPVAFNLAANAGNGDQTPTGDYVYVKEITSKAN